MRSLIVASLFVAPVFGQCPAVPPGGCSVCGEGKCVTNTNGLFAFPGFPSAPCGLLQQAGYTGIIPLSQCPFLPGLLAVCECGTAGSPVAPSPVAPPVAVAPAVAVPVTTPSLPPVIDTSLAPVMPSTASPVTLAPVSETMAPVTDSAAPVTFAPATSGPGPTTPAPLTAMPVTTTVPGTDVPASTPAPTPPSSSAIRMGSIAATVVAAVALFM